METTKSEATANRWIAEGYAVHVTTIDGPHNRYCKGDRKFSDDEQIEALHAIAAICADICEERTC